MGLVRMIECGGDARKSPHFIQTFQISSAEPADDRSAGARMCDCERSRVRCKNRNRQGSISGVYARRANGFRRPSGAVRCSTQRIAEPARTATQQLPVSTAIGQAVARK